MPKYIAIAHKLLAEVASAHADFSKAEAELNTALAQLEMHPAPLLAWKIYAALGRLRLQLGEARSASEAFSHSAAIIGKIEAEISDDRLRRIFMNSEVVREVLQEARKAYSVSTPKNI